VGLREQSFEAVRVDVKRSLHFIRQARPAKRISSLTRFQHRHNQNHVDSREDVTARIISPSFVEGVLEST
jgi:hypothetical protein